MKNRGKAFPIFIAGLLLARILVAGNESGHGGDPLAIEFVQRGHDIYSFLLSETAARILGSEELSAFKVALKETRVDLVDTRLIDRYGSEVTALETPDPKRPAFKLIQINRRWWQQALESGKDLYRFVFHEYLWVIEKDDQNYAISNQLDISALSRIHAPPRNPLEWSEELVGRYRTNGPNCHNIWVRAVSRQDQSVELSADTQCPPLTGRYATDRFDCDTAMAQCLDNVHSGHGIVFKAIRTGAQTFSIEKYLNHAFLGAIKFFRNDGPGE